MHTNKDNKISTQRNITPNYLKYKRTSHPTQANHPPNQADQKSKVSTTRIQLKGVAPKPVDVVSMSIKKEFYISAKSVLAALTRKYFSTQSQRWFARTQQKTQRRSLSYIPKEHSQ